MFEEISPTIFSQTHNYFSSLVNEKNLENTMSNKEELFRPANDDIKLINLWNAL